jgi:hypothetical protein
MFKPDAYTLALPSAPSPTLAARAYDLTWRFDFTAPGFCLLDCGPSTDSHTLRIWMLALKDELNSVAVARGLKPFAFRSMARFDQQETTKLHLDGASEQSMLMLGYEPSRVVSRLFLAHYTRAAFDLGITPQQFLHDYNPMYRPGEELLQRYLTELPQPAERHARILLINNSSLPFTEASRNPRGVMHQAIIVKPDESQRRIINSTMLVTEGDEVDAERQQEFVRTDKISQKNY